MQAQGTRWPIRTPFDERPSLRIESQASSAPLNGELRHAHQQHPADILASIADAVVTTDLNTRITYLNPVAERLTGWDATEAIGQLACDVMMLVAESTREKIACMVERCLREGRAVDLQAGALLVRRDGREIPIGDSAAPIHNGAGVMVGVVLVVHDESEQRRVGHRLTFDAAHDSLTALPNRREFEKLLTQLIARPFVSHTSHVLLYLDLDRFKHINDTYGHDAGDAVLRGIGPVIARQLRASDTLARLGGDEFGVLLVNCARGDADRIADGIRLDVEAWRCAWMETIMTVGVSIGLVDITSNTDHMSAVMRAADAACYCAKSRGGGVVHYAPPRTEVRDFHRNTLPEVRV